MHVDFADLTIMVCLPGQLVKDIVNHAGNARHLPPIPQECLPREITYVQAADHQTFIGTPFILSDFDATWRGK